MKEIREKNNLVGLKKDNKNGGGLSKISEFYELEGFCPKKFPVETDVYICDECELVDCVYKVDDDGNSASG